MLDERSRRLVAGAESVALPRRYLGGLARNGNLPSCNSSRHGGVEESQVALIGRVRRPGGGRKRAERDAAVLVDLERLVDPVTRGDPESPLRWTCKSVRKLAEDFGRWGMPSAIGWSPSCYRSWATASRPTARRRGQGTPRPQRPVRAHQPQGPAFHRPAQPVDLGGHQEEGTGRQLQESRAGVGAEGRTRAGESKDFLTRAGQVAPYGVYDLTANEGWVNVGNGPRHGGIRRGDDPAVVAVDGAAGLPGGRAIAGDSRLRRQQRTARRLWKVGLQELADEMGLRIAVCHFPPGTSKWNKIEHRMFCHITQNWRGRPLVSHEVVVNLIAAHDDRDGPAGPGRTGYQLLPRRGSR